MLFIFWQLKKNKKCGQKTIKNFDRTLIRILFVLLLQKTLVSLHIHLVMRSANLAPFEKGKIDDDEPPQQNPQGVSRLSDSI